MPTNARSKPPAFDSERAAQALEKARATRKAAAENTTLRRDFLDAGWWEDLARKRGVRLPQWGIPCTVSKMRTWIRRLGLTVTEYQAAYGKEVDFIRLNPDWPLRSFVGLVLEKGGSAYEVGLDNRRQSKEGK